MKHIDRIETVSFRVTELHISGGLEKIWRWGYVRIQKIWSFKKIFIMVFIISTLKYLLDNVIILSNILNKLIKIKISNCKI